MGAAPTPDRRLAPRRPELASDGLVELPERCSRAHAFDVEAVKNASEAGGYEVVHSSPGLEIGVYVLVAPEPDRQQPHEDDEIYVVLEGTACSTSKGRRSSCARATRSSSPPAPSTVQRVRDAEPARDLREDAARRDRDAAGARAAPARRVLARGELPLGRADLPARQPAAARAAATRAREAAPARPLRHDARA